MFATGLLQARKGITASSPRLTSSTAADLPFLHILPDIAFTEVVVNRQPGLFQNQQQFGLIPMKPFEPLPERGKTHARGTEFFKTPLDVFFQRFIRRRLVDL